MDLVLPYINPRAFASALISNYGFENQETWNSNLLALPDRSGHGALQLFICNNVHFFRGKWKFNEPTLFYSHDVVGQKGYIDFRIGADRRIRSCSIEGLKRFEFDTTEVDGMRIFIPERFLPEDRNRIHHRLERSCLDANIKKLLDEVFAIDPQEITNAMLIESKILEFIGYWQAFLSRNDTTVFTHGVSDHQYGCISIARQFLDENFSRAISIKELSRKSGLNECDLKRCFRMLVGMPVRQYIIKTRLEKARQIIRSSELPLHTISRNLGYENQTHFVTMYIRFFGVHPKNDR